MQIDPFVFHRFPQALDKHIVPPGATPVHAELAPQILDCLHELMRGELAALIGIHNLRPAMAAECLLQHIDRMAGLQRDGDLRCQYTARGPVHYGGEVDEAFGHRNVGRIQCPNLVDPVDVQTAQQTGVNFMAGVLLAGARLSV